MTGFFVLFQSSQGALVIHILGLLFAFVSPRFSSVNCYFLSGLFLVSVFFKPVLHPLVFCCFLGFSLLSFASSPPTAVLLGVCPFSSCNCVILFPFFKK